MSSARAHSLRKLRRTTTVPRIGYLSADFRMHPVLFFIEPILRNHRKSHFSIHCYSNVRNADSATNRIRGLADAWTDIHGLPDEEVAEHIHKDRIDILVDLSGHTSGNRLKVF